MFDFSTTHQDADSAARCGTFSTPHGVVKTPVFMPVGTRGTVKGVTPQQLRDAGSTIILGNTFHLALRPGEETVRALGGLHRFAGWDGPILTDSGGFQVYSLAERTKISEEAATFHSPVDGATVVLTPERAVAIQETLGSDIAMCLDHVIALPNETPRVADAMRRSLRWAKRCQEAAQCEMQTLFAIVQGGLDPDLRRESAEKLVAMDFRGYAIGGLSVGEEPQAMYDTLDFTVPHLPRDKPRYLMGVGTPRDILNGILRGVDMFDCVMPTRCGRNALAFTDSGTVKLRNAKHARNDAPLDAFCPCPACRHSRGYLRHLFMTDEMLGPILVSIHNITYYHRLVAQAREAIRADRLSDFVRERCEAF
ncbi:MAG: tRNA guanosine(34) transglycosylase Tgt [Thermoguttaceae bacterium]